MKREKYSDDLVNQVLDFVLDFIKEMLGEKPHNDDSSERSNNTSSRMKSSNSGDLNVTPVLVIFDTVHLMDEASWRLFDIVREECQRIAIVLLMQTDSNSRLRLHSESQKYFNENISLESFMRVIDLPPLKIEELNHLIYEIAPKYQTMMQDDIHQMTHIEDVAHSIRNP